MLPFRTGAVAAVLVGISVPLAAQTPEQLATFHNQVVTLIAELASRPLTPGDTFLTLNPNPGGLMHTVRLQPGVMESSLLRADRMLGTARVTWSASEVQEFDVLWTRADTLHGAGVDSAIAVRGRVEQGSINLSVPAGRTLPIPSLRWAVADFGMEEQLIPLFRSLATGTDGAQVVLLRPYHLHWDTISVSVRDSAGLRLAVTRGKDHTHEVWIIDEAGRLLYVRRVDQPGDRVPLPTSDAYAAMRSRAPLIRALLEPYPAPTERAK